MAARDTAWTYISVTGVAVLIWFWAAGATREQRQIRSQLQFAPADSSSNWTVQPHLQPVQIAIEGSRWSLQKASELFSSALTIDVLPLVGPQVHDMVTELSRNSRVRETGVRIVSCDPPSVPIDVDRLERVAAPIRVNLAGVQTVGELQVDPPEATVILPSLLRKRLPDQLALEAVVTPSQIKDLAPGVKHTLSAALRLPDAGVADATIEPSAAKVTFMIRSRIEETPLDSVRVQLAGPHQDFDEYAVDLDDTLRDVTVAGEAELIRRIAAGEVRVIALVHLTTNEKERGITSKHVSAFLAIAPDGSMTPVTARVNGSTELPEVAVRITRRPRAAAPDTTAPAVSPGLDADKTP